MRRSVDDDDDDDDETMVVVVLTIDDDNDDDDFDCGGRRRSAELEDEKEDARGGNALGRALRPTSFAVTSTTSSTGTKCRVDVHPVHPRRLDRHPPPGGGGTWIGTGCRNGSGRGGGISAMMRILPPGSSCRAREEIDAEYGIHPIVASVVPERRRFHHIHQLSIISPGEGL